MPALQLYLLGALDIRRDDQPLDKPPTLKSQSLLAYLALHREHPQARERLAGLFWGDRPERKARRSLTTALWHIRRCLPDQEMILGDLHTVQFDLHADLWLDVESFESHVSQDDLVSLQSAVSLYRGDFLEGFYDDWIISERYRLEGLFTETLARLMAGYEAEGERQAALATALRLLAHDPLREDAHRVAMRAYCHLGQRNAALEQYQRCQRTVQDELGAEPMVETVELYQAILEGRIEIGRAPDAPPAPTPMIEPAVPVGRSPLDAMAPSKLVGREQELAFLDQRWQGMAARQGGLVLIGGEAGVGKTRLVEEFATRLRWQGSCVLWGRCYEFERVLPYQPVAEALRMALPALTPSALADLPSWTLKEIARLVPEVLEGRPDLESTPAIRSDEERARLFDGLTRFLAHLSAQGPLLIVLEDLHWATESTLQLIHYLTRHLTDHQVLTLGTMRPEALGPQHPMRAFQQQLAREGLAESLPLPRLSPAAVEAMVAEMSGRGETVTPLAARLYDETEGNPFFLIEIVKALFETGVIHLEEGGWAGDYGRTSEKTIPLPAGVSEAIQARVRRLDEKTQEVLRLAAVLGREFDFDLLNEVWGHGEEATLEALDTLLRRRLIDEGIGSMGRDYAFTHHKIQEVVYASVPRIHRQHAHARTGQAMECLYGADTEPLADELAFHFQEAAIAEKAVDYLSLAGEQARRQYANEEAITYFRRALALLEDGPPDAPRQKTATELHDKLGDVLFLTGQVEEAVGHYQQALALLKERGEHERAARMLMKLGLTFHNAFDFRRSRQAYEEGFALWQQAERSETDASLPPAPHALRVAYYDLWSLDPTRAAHPAIDQLFSGLVELSPEMEILPDVARTWEVLEGGRRYIFHLQDDVRWSDDAPVTAQDFEYAWKRVLDPATEWWGPYLLYDIKGARAFHQGEAKKAGVDVRALDPLTLAVELEEPTGHFPYILAHSVANPVPQHTVEAYGEAWADAANIVTNGPFRLETWRRGECVMLVRNPAYHGRFRGNVQRVELHLTSDWHASLEMYETGGLDVLWINLLPLAELDQARQRHAGEYAPRPYLMIYGVGFNMRQPPFDDVRVRQAFIMAIDREALMDVHMRGVGFPVTGGFIPPGMPGHSPGISLPYDPERARRLMLEAGYPEGSGCGFPIVGVDRVSTPVTSQGLEYVDAQWRENLGVDVTWEKMDLESYRDRLRTDPPHLTLMYWSSGYPDPYGFLRDAVDGARQATGWRNESYDQLVEKARRTMDSAERLALYQQADRMLMEEAPIWPVAQGRTHLLVKPWISNLPASPDKWWFWKDVVIEPH